MSIEGVLSQEANQIAAQFQKRAANLKIEYLEAQKLAEDKKTQFDFASLAIERIANFKVKLGGDYQCPRCWIERETRSPLIAVPSQSRDDILKCKRCGHTVILTY